MAITNVLLKDELENIIIEATTWKIEIEVADRITISMNKIASLIGQNLRRSTREIINILHISYKSLILHLKKLGMMDKCDV